MLSRVVDSLYWLARYIERAGNMARLVEVSSTLLLDAETEEGDQDEYWRPILEAAALTELYEKNKPAPNEPDTIPWFLTLSKSNTDSIRSFVAAARENARMVRDQISEEMWREINTLHLFLNSSDARTLYENDFDEFCQRIINFSLLFSGITDATLSRNIGWQFMQVGKFLERADKTSRILDIPNRVAGQQLAEEFAWSAVLGSCSARAAYRESNKSGISGITITNLLIYSSDFPRSVRFCIREVDRALHAISGSPSHDYLNRAEKLAGRLLASLDFGGIDEIEQKGVREFVDQLQIHFNELGGEIYSTYMATKPMPEITEDPTPPSRTPKPPYSPGKTGHAHSSRFIAFSSDQEQQEQQQQ